MSSDIVISDDYDDYYYVFAIPNLRLDHWPAPLKRLGFPKSYHSNRLSNGANSRRTHRSRIPVRARGVNPNGRPRRTTAAISHRRCRRRFDVVPTTESGIFVHRPKVHCLTEYVLTRAPGARGALFCGVETKGLQKN